jgi:hypothetical protein
MKQTTYVRVATLTPLPANALVHGAVRGGAAGIFFQGQAKLSRRPGYEHLDLADRRQVPVRQGVTSGSSGRLLRASFYGSVRDKSAGNAARQRRGAAA